MPLTTPWPSTALPTIERSGRFPHRDRQFEIVYRQVATNALHMYEYPCQMRIAGRTLHIEPGDLTISPHRSHTSYHLPKPGHHLCVHFTPGPKLPRHGRVQLPLHLRPGPLRQTLNARLLTVIRWHRLAPGQPAARAAASAALQELLLSLTLTHPTLPADTTDIDQATERAAEFLEWRLDQSVSVPQLAKTIGLSQNYLARRFRQRFGMTIPHYLLTRRIELAAELLTSTDLPVKHIAARAGLPDPQYFNKQFRRLTGLSPTAWRRRALA